MTIMSGRTESTSFQAVEDWLRSLGLLHYAQSFYDNGYEDIDTCKEIKEADLNVIDIKTERDRHDILNAVNKLQQNLYFELEPERTENIVERSKIETIVLKTRLKECLEREKIILTEPPYYNADGTLGDLYPLAIRYATELATFFDDVMEALDQLRKRQLPVENYNVMAMEKRSPRLIRDERSHDSNTKNPADYLNCETPEPICKRSSSFSKYDTRVTKSTTDLSKDNVHIPGGSPKSKPKRSKNILHVFKKSDHRSVYRPKAAPEFNASELDISQNEILNLFKQIKSKELSQEDALDMIKRRGLTKSSSFDGSQHLHMKLIESQSSRLPGENDAGMVTKSKVSSKSLKSGLKNRTASAQFYPKDDDICQSQASLISTDSKSSLETSGDNSGFLVDEDRLSVCSKNSPESGGKQGIIKKIRNSMRKKGKLPEENVDKGSIPLDAATQNDGIVCFKPLTDSEQLFFTPIEADLPTETKGDASSGSNLNLGKVVPPPPLTPPPPPPSEFGDNISSNIQSQEGEIRDRKPSLKIKLYPKYQEESLKRRAVEKNNNLPCTTSATTNTTVPTLNIFTMQQAQLKRASMPDTIMFSTPSIDESTHSSQSFDIPPTDLISDLNKSIPKIPPRPAPRKPRPGSGDITWRQSFESSESNEPSPVVPIRRSKVLRAESTERRIDELGKEMNDIIAGLDNELHQLNDMSGKSEFIEPVKEEAKTPKESSLVASSKPLLPLKASTLGWKKPVPPPRPQVHRSTSLTQASNVVRDFIRPDEATKVAPNSGGKVSDMAGLLKPLDSEVKKNISEVVSQKKLINKKLSKEMIVLTAHPYTSKEGAWGVPYNLILRYAEELAYSVEDVIEIFEEIRVESGAKNGQDIITLDKENLHAKNIQDDCSLNDWLLYIGLPMFIEDLQEVGIITIDQLRQLSEYDINHIGIFEKRHVKLLLDKLKELT